MMQPALLTCSSRAMGRAALAAALACGVYGCVARGKSRPEPTRQATRRAAPERIVMDGQFADWPEGVAALADPHYLYFKLGLEAEGTLQESPSTRTLLLDADGKASTGAQLSHPPEAAALGVDLEVQFSPPGGRGVAAFVRDSAGNRTPVTNDQISLLASPTHASPWFEVRISRQPWAAPELAQAMAGSSSGKAMFTLEENGAIVGWSDPEVFPKSTAAKGVVMSDAAIPAKEPGAIRVVSWNVRDQAPMNNPSPFSRVLTALSPDVILVQEWEGADAATLQAWCTALLTGEGEWHAVTGGAQGVGIISRFPAEALGTGGITLPGDDGQPAPVPWVAAVVHAPTGDLAVSSVQLSCCGALGGPQDERRHAEAAAINQAMRLALAGSGAGLRVIGGDLGLVGSRTPLDTLRAGLDQDGSDLNVAEPMVLGAAAQFTWRDPQSPFPPARLDYMLYSESAADAQSFVFDTQHLTEGSLARIGLDRGDTAASDHLPVVIDLRLRTP